MSNPIENSNERDVVNLESVASNVEAKIRQEAVRDALKLSFSDPKTRIPEDVAVLMSTVVRSLALEGILRAARQAGREQLPCIELEQVEKILPQLMLDFP